MSRSASDTNKLKTDALYSVGALRQLISVTAVESLPLVEAFFLALAVHVLLLPVIWCVGWALPWPKSPVVTSVIEIDLSSWPRLGKAKKLYEFRNPEQND